jgi:cation transport ATPase
MHLDFASEYAKRSDEEIRLLVKDRQNLVDEARDALDVEVQKRRNNGFQLHIHEPEEPRVQVEEDEEDGNEVVVRSRELIFPSLCPRCLSDEVGSIVKISCASASSWGLVLAFDFVSGLWGYLFFRYPVPFCRSCATSVKVRRWAEMALILIAIAGSLYTAIYFHLSALVVLLVLIGLFAVGGLLWKRLDLSKRWPPEGIEILSKWSARERRLQFANPAYEKAFVALNGARPRQVGRA